MSCILLSLAHYTTEFLEKGLAERAHNIYKRPDQKTKTQVMKLIENYENGAYKKN